MPTDLDFAGKTVLVTGSSRGIGAGMIRAFAARQARCAINFVADPAGKNEADAKHISAELPGSILVQCDVSKSSEVAGMMQKIQQEFGQLDILINNAGILRDRTIKKMSESDWADVLRVNLDGTFHCTQAAAAILMPGGRIVNMASVNAVAGFFGTANYAASKAGVIALTKVSARELAKQQITVNAIAPGFVDTEMIATMPDEAKKQFLSQIPLGRFATTDDIAAAAIFLCSDLARYITGQVIHVNGGFMMP